jgi:hypothetical protein
MNVNYQEGDWFAIPLQSSGYGLGLIARGSKKTKVLFGFFFGPKRDNMPIAKDILNLSVNDAVWYCKFGDLWLFKGRWPIIFSANEWDRKKWPMPDFLRVEGEDGPVWRVTYNENNPAEIISEVRVDKFSNIERSSVFGADAVEVRLSKILKLH